MALTTEQRNVLDLLSKAKTSKEKDNAWIQYKIHFLDNIKDSTISKSWTIIGPNWLNKIISAILQI